MKHVIFLLFFFFFFIKKERKNTEEAFLVWERPKCTDQNAHWGVGKVNENIKMPSYILVQFLNLKNNKRILGVQKWKEKKKLFSWNWNITYLKKSVQIAIESLVNYPLRIQLCDHHSGHEMEHSLSPRDVSMHSPPQRYYYPNF